MQFKNSLIKFIAIPFLAGLLIIVQPVFGQAAAPDPLRIAMDMSGGSEETVMPEMASPDPIIDDMPEAASDSHDQGETMEDGSHDPAGTLEEGSHDETDQGINWPVISIFAAINGAALATAAVMRRKKLMTNEVAK